MRDWALITGASSGIGRAVAIELAKVYDVVLVGRDEARLKETARLCHPAQTRLLPLDLLDQEHLQTKLSGFLKAEGLTISRFAFCAGISPMLPLRQTSLDVFRKTLDTNLIAPFLMTQILASKQHNAGALKSVVFISSHLSNRGAKAFAAYGASKAGLDGLMRCLAAELAPAVRVNSVLPGTIRTPMTEKVFENEEVVERMRRRYPLGWGKVEDIAKTVSFLLSDESSWITGQQITVDGGATMDISG